MKRRSMTGLSLISAFCPQIGFIAKSKRIDNHSSCVVVDGEMQEHVISIRI